MLWRLRRLITADLLVLSALSVVLQILYLVVLPISLEGDGVGYYLFARFLANDPGGLFISQRPPGYPVFLLATGATWLKSLYLTIAVQALMGALAPLLVYGTLRGMGRRAAFAAALAYALSGVPYSYAKLLVTEQLFVFCLLTAIFAVARFIDARRPQAAALAIGAAVAPLMVRNEALYFAIFVFAVLLFLAWPVGRRLLTVALFGAAALAVVMAWSAERAIIMGNPALVGSLHNLFGHQLFWRVYASLPGPVRFWQCVVVLPRDPSCNDGSTPLALLVQPKNGPATRRLADLVADWAVEYHQDPKATVAAFVGKPSDELPVDWNGLAANVAVNRLGPVEGDELLRQAAVEAIKAHPEILYMMAASISPYFGISFENFWYALRYPRNAGPILFANWGEDAMEALPFNLHDLARQDLQSKLWSEYRKSNEAPATSFDKALLHLSRTGRNLVRDLAGLVFLVTLPALLWARPRALAVFLLGSFALMLGAYAVAFGYSMRFEHVILPLMLMLTVVAIETLVRGIAGRLRRRRQSAAYAGRLSCVPTDRGIP